MGNKYNNKRKEVLVNVKYFDVLLRITIENGLVPEKFEKLYLSFRRFFLLYADERKEAVFYINSSDNTYICYCMFYYKSVLYNVHFLLLNMFIQRLFNLKALNKTTLVRKFKSYSRSQTWNAVLVRGDLPIKITTIEQCGLH